MARGKNEGERPGQVLMKMLKSAFKRSEDKKLEVPEAAVPNLVPFGDVTGCLAIHIKSCRYFTPKMTVKLYYSSLFVRITINNVVKSTKMCSFLDENRGITIINFDEMKCFSVQVPRRQDDARNNIYLELMQCDAKESYPALLGTIQVHLYEVIQKGCFTEEFQIFNRNTFICRMEVEFMFSYGNFGFGFSHQLKPLQKIIEPSMFMNIAPPPERTDPVSNVIVPQSVAYPAFLSPDLNVTVGKSVRATSRSSQQSAVRLVKLQDPPRERLEKMKKEYRKLSTWAEKVNYLESVFTPELQQKEPKGLTSLRVFSCRCWWAKNTAKMLRNLLALRQITQRTISTASRRQFENKVQEKQKLFQEDNGIPVYLKAISLIKDEDESIPDQPVDFDKTLPTLTLTTLKQSTQDVLDGISLKSVEPENEPYQPSPYSHFSTVKIANENKEPYEIYPPTEELKARYPSSSKTDSPPPESNVYAYSLYEDFTSPLDSDLGNANEKERKVSFPSKNYLSRSSRPKSIDTNIPYKFQTFNIKDSFESFLRNVNNKSPDSKRKRQDMLECQSTLSAEVVEHEDQDPPYPIQPKSEEPTDKIQTPELKATAEPLTTESKENLPNKSLLNVPLESPVTTSTEARSLSKLLKRPSFIENLRQARTFQPILTQTLQEFLDKFFSNPDVLMDIEPRMKSCQSPVQSVSDEAASSLEEEALEKPQGLKSWRSKRDVLLSASAFNQVIKDRPPDSLSEGRSGTSTQIDKEHTSARDLVASVRSSYIKQIFTAAIFSELLKGSSTEEDVQGQLLTERERSLSSHNRVHYEKKDDKKAVVSPSELTIKQIMEAFPVESLLESGLIKVTEVGAEDGEHSLKDAEKGSPEEKPHYPTEEFSKVKIRIYPPSEHSLPTTLQGATGVLNTDGFLEESQNTLPQDSKYYSVPNRKTDFPSDGQSLHKDESNLYATLENITDSVGKLNEADVIILKSFLKHIFEVFFQYHQPERRKKPEGELQRLIQYSFTNDTEDLEGIREDFDKAEKLGTKPILNPKLRLFLEELSESEIKNLKSELSKHVQHYLVERLSESGYITKEDLPKIYQTLYFMNEKSEPRGQSIFQEKYSDTVKEVMSFVNNFHNNFIDKHLEIKLRSFLTEILKNYFLENLSESKLFRETETGSISSNTSSLRTKSFPVSLHDSGQDISRGHFDRSLENNMEYPLNKYLQDSFYISSDPFSKYLQDYFFISSENELSRLKDELSKYFQRLFLEKLSKSGLITKRQFELIKQYLVDHSSSKPFEYMTDFSFRDENKLLEEHSEKQNKDSNIAQKTTSQTVPKERLLETELTRHEEKESFSSQNTKEVRDQKRYFSKDEAKASHLRNVQCASNFQASSFNKPSERLTNTMFKNEQKEHGFRQFVPAENSIFKAETQDICCWDAKSKLFKSNACFERTLERKPAEKKEHVNIYKVTIQKTPEARPLSYPRVPNCRMPDNDEGHPETLTYPSWQSHTCSHFNAEDEVTSKLDQYCRRIKGNNNNNRKQHSTVLTEHRKDMKIPYNKNIDIFSENYANIPESQYLKCNVLEMEKNSNPFLFLEVLKRESLKPKVPKEKDHVSKQKKSFSKMLPVTLPSTKKSIPRTMLRWNARTTIHDCLDKFEDLPVASPKHFEKTKSKSKLLGMSPDDNHNLPKHFARPSTAPAVNRHQRAHSAKGTSPRLTSAGLMHTRSPISNNEMQPKKRN
ncbi:PREDICTED: uncharacterized protein LOC102861346 [Elephantulus edwardii]|uniref:uncharacterized protein LOC102861346 n=1 Tax=Elephantulus edwardii TaxID=28737 RepID=UPI0003F0C124|nr:PREDICTED: uncharacterized protein LOC102861346 [Elephantulus edwardii]